MVPGEVVADHRPERRRQDHLRQRAVRHRRRGGRRGQHQVRRRPGASARSGRPDDASRGLGRTFQHAELFPELTAEENVLVVNRWATGARPAPGAPAARVGRTRRPRPPAPRRPLVRPAEAGRPRPGDRGVTPPADPRRAVRRAGLRGARVSRVAHPPAPGGRRLRGHHRPRPRRPLRRRRPGRRLRLRAADRGGDAGHDPAGPDRAQLLPRRGGPRGPGRPVRRRREHRARDRRRVPPLRRRARAGGHRRSRWPRGRSLGIVGTNGAGKSTLGRILHGSLKPSDGTRTSTARVSLVPEGRALFKTLSVRENLEVAAYAAASGAPGRGAGSTS